MATATNATTTVRHHGSASPTCPESRRPSVYRSGLGEDIRLAESRYRRPRLPVTCSNVYQGKQGYESCLPGFGVLDWDQALDGYHDVDLWSGPVVPIRLGFN